MATNGSICYMLFLEYFAKKHFSFAESRGFAEHGLRNAALDRTGDFFVCYFNQCYYSMQISRTAFVGARGQRYSANTMRTRQTHCYEGYCNRRRVDDTRDDNYVRRFR